MTDATEPASAPVLEISATIVAKTRIFIGVTLDLAHQATSALALRENRLRGPGLSF